MPDDVLTSTLQTALAALPAATPLWTGYSGGLDSSVLLHALARVPLARQRGLRAVHVHHGLHPQADAWADHCERVCHSLEVPLRLLRVEVPQAPGGQGPEGSARQARHAAFATLLEAGGTLALAHHRDDQAETFLLRALRASGPDGLAVMRPRRPLGGGWLWRPLLAIARATLRDYAQVHGLDWIEDPSNRNTDFDRNFLRHRILPLLRQRWPQADAAIARSAALCADASDMLHVHDDAWLDHHDRADPHTLPVAALLAQPPAQRARLLRRWIERLCLPALPAAGLTAVEHDLLPAPEDARARFDWQDATLQRWRGWLHAERRRPPLPAGWETGWNGLAPLALPGGGWLALQPRDAGDIASRPMRVHARHGGERIVLPGRTHSHALKHVLQQRDVPPWQRARLPLLSTPEGELLAAGDIAISAGFDAWLREHALRLAWTADAAPDDGRD